MARSTALSRSLQPTHEPKTFSHTSTPTPLSHALRSSSAWLRFQRRVWCSMWRCSKTRARITPGTSLSANHCAHERWWSQIRPSGSVDSPSNATPARAASTARRSSGRASFIVSRNTPSTPRSATSAAIASSSETGSRRVPTSHGL